MRGSTGAGSTDESSADGGSTDEGSADKGAALPLDPRLTDLQVARHVTELRAQQLGLAPGPVVGVEISRQRTAKARIPDTAQVRTTDLRVPTRAGDRGGRLYEPTAGASGVVLFLHGGGWVLGDLEMNDALCRDLAVASGTTLLSLDYRLAPEHPFPAALHDAADALCWLATGADGLVDEPLRLAVAGHSAGGNLAAVLAQHSADGLLPPIAHQLLLCPVLDCDVDRPSYAANACGLPLTRDDMIWYWDLYHPDVSTRSHPDASPLRRPALDRLAPATIVVAEADPLRDEALEYADRLDEAGVAVRLVRQNGVPHLFLNFAGMTSRADAIDSAAAGLRGALGA
ncbi:alpha/beta hydrolase [Agreia sp. COWG]|uniref:alpha/beta hydrolase n=1 Tax=Agreia sp. COWG TaxID=2773266 RepID=UPI001925C4EC|nr:alpha/beta hydrolase [Agreia sp. COWG]CAD6008772.1 Abhydrolase_3 domain-containing protein [Agreia sp. COWG]